MSGIDIGGLRRSLKQNKVITRYAGKDRLIPKSLYKSLKAKKVCKGCGKKSKVPLQIHHIKPVSEGGTNEANNLRVLCKQCHTTAHTKRKRRGGVKMRFVIEIAGGLLILLVVVLLFAAQEDKPVAEGVVDGSFLGNTTMMNGTFVSVEDIEPYLFMVDCSLPEVHENETVRIILDGERYGVDIVSVSFQEFCQKFEKQKGEKG